MVDSTVHALATFAHQLRLAAVPSSVRRRAAYVLLDTCGAIIAGKAEPEVSALSAAVREAGPAALLADGAAGVALEIDEGSIAARGHPAMHIVPAALHAAVEAGVSGARTLEAVIAAYEVCARIGAATQLRTGMHPHGAWGAAGAAVASGLLRRLPEHQLAEALGVAATLGLGTTYAAVRDGATARNLWTGAANLLGWAAAQAAEAGFTAPRRALEISFGEILGARFDTELALDELGSHWYLEGSYFKEYACCRHAHAALDALAAAADGLPRLAADAVKSVTIHTYAQAVQATGGAEFPQSVLAAKFSLPYVAAAALSGEGVGQEAFSRRVRTSADLRALAAKIVVVEDSQYTAMMPDASPARVAVCLTNGSVREAQVLQAGGDPGDPGWPGKVEAKFQRLAGQALGTARAHSLAQTLLTLDAQPSVDVVWEALRG